MRFNTVLTQWAVLTQWFTFQAHLWLVVATSTVEAFGNKVPIPPPRVDSSKGPNRVNRGPLAHWPTKENRQNFGIFWIFPAYEKNGLRWPQIGSGGFFPANPDLANIFGRTDFDFDNLYFFDFWTPN